MTELSVTPRWFSNRVLKWHAQHGRQDLPWKIPRDPYRIWLSEIMLQQTQVQTVIPYYERFLKRFPNLKALATATQAQVLQHWAGLGYYARARNLHKTAQIIHHTLEGQFPQECDALVALPGIGQSTAGAILAQAFDIWAPILDGNVKRVLSRFHRITGTANTTTVLKQLWQLAEHYTPRKAVAPYTQAIMDMGATLCTRTQPNCTHCPVQSRCQAYQDCDPLRYPQTAPRKRIPHRNTNVLILMHPHEKILLVERPDKGIWGGLWSLPEFSLREAAETFVQKWDKKNQWDWEPLSPVKHAFTHYRLTLHPFLIRLPSAKQVRLPKMTRWVDRKDCHQVGLPAPIHKIMLSLNKRL